MFKTWDQYSELEKAAVIYSDAHKDAYGFRPRDGGVHNPKTLEEYDAAIEACARVIEREQDEERVRCLEAQKGFEEDVQQMIDLGATDRAAAVRWVFESYGATPEELANPRYHTQEIEHAAYGTLPIPLWPFILPEVIPGYRPY